MFSMPSDFKSRASGRVARISWPRVTFCWENADLPFRAGGACFETVTLTPFRFEGRRGQELTTPAAPSSPRRRVEEEPSPSQPSTRTPSLVPKPARPDPRDRRWRAASPLELVARRADLLSAPRLNDSDV